MDLLTLDFETLYSKEYSLRKMDPASYILDPQFEVICVAVKVNNGPTEVLDGPDFTRWLANYPPGQCMSLTFNSLFDNAILAWRYGWVPARMIDGLGLARYCLGHQLRRLGLEYVAEHLGIGQKRDEIKTMLGVGRAALNQMPAFKKAFYDYCANDNELCFGVFQKLAPQIPPSEFQIMDLVLRAAVCPVFRPNIKLLEEHHAKIVADKENLINASGLDKGDLSSEEAFTIALQNLGVEVDTKVTAKGNIKPALAKTDDFMKSLEEHDDPQVQALAAARLGVKSTLEEKRCERLLRIAGLDWSPLFGGPVMPIPLRYSGAHTLRLSGDWKINMQNLPAGRGGKSTALRDSLEAPEGYEVVVGDLGQIEARLTAWLTHAPLLDVFKSGQDAYKYMASVIFGVSIDQVTKDQRQVGKAAVLGLGFGLGKGNFYIKTIAAARMNGQDISSFFTPELAELTVTKYRQSQKPTVVFWEFLNELLRREWMGLAAPRQVGPVEIGHGYVKGPGGATMHYGVPYGLGEGCLPYPGDQWDDILYEYGGRRKKIYGAAFLENIIQFLARIILFNAAIRMAKQGYSFAHTTHDELVFVVPQGEVDKVKALLHLELTRPPSWAPDLPLKADIGSGVSYGTSKN